MDWDTHKSVSSPDEELVLRDLATRLDARPVFHPGVIIWLRFWHPLARAVPQLHRGAIVSQAEPLAALEEDIL
eukprot:5017314-Amphidinium_carterae.1